jgi:hypothetical protein
MNEPSGRRGSVIPARLLRIDLEISVTASSWPTILDFKIFSKLVSKLYQIEQVENDETLVSNESPKKLSESSSSASKLGRQKSLTKKKT